MSRAELLTTVAAWLEKLSVGHPLRVGIDGCDAAGKTTFADELGDVLRAAGRAVIRASIDGFHNPASVRHRRGSESAEGYFFDSFDNAALVRELLAPLGPGGTRVYRRAIFDFRRDRPRMLPAESAASDAMLIFDGVFLHRAELAEFWDFSIFLDVDFEAAIARAESRDCELFGSASVVRERYERRYVPGQELYFAQCDPQRRANLVICNIDPSQPSIRSARGVP